ncbi:MAG: putative cytosol aminopeptidase [candidate division TM6 bacterium GW2011_GWF2_32_72]|nr:MAG: putative cytosol aminopeptidase [candidate division TM6 bacterium GW2011_GWF2_32_72]
MEKIKIINKSFLETDVSGYGFFVTEEEVFPKDLKKLAEISLLPIDQLIKERQFKGGKSEKLHFPVLINNKIKHVVLVGLGSKEKTIEIESYRGAVGTLYRTAECLKLKSLAVSLPVISLFKTDLEDLAKQTASTWVIASYNFDEFMSKKTGAEKNKEVELEIIVASDEHKAVKVGVDYGCVVAEAANMARRWIDLPANIVFPTYLADRAEEVAKSGGLKIQIFGEKDVISMGMGGLEAVSKGSHRDCHLVIMEYNCGKKTAPTIGLVGKGVTFDSGGLSLKPAASMETMKEDMSGAAAVIAAMKVISELKPKVNVIAAIPLTENLPSGTATKPGDIIRFYNGKTAEILNTDAEGRLILADALAYISKNYALDALLDIATLTGACIYATGPFFSGLMSQDQKMLDRVQKAGNSSGDAVWSLPFIDDYRAAIKSPVADISNCGSPRYKAGTSTAGLFLSNFVEEGTPWAHLDIAPTAFNVPDRSYFRSGATGVGVRLLVDFVMNWEK